MSLYDLNDAQEQRADGVVPDGTFCTLRMKIRPGGENIAGASADDIGLFKESMTSDVRYIDAEFTIIDGPHEGRKLWKNFTIAGGKVGEDGVSKAWHISKSFFRAAVDSALNLSPKDMSDASKAKRNLPSFRSMDGLEFHVKVGIERGGAMPGGGQYPDKNRIAHVVVPGEPQYALMKAGKEITPAPSQTEDPVASTPPWQQDKPAIDLATPTSAGPAWLKGDKK
jgi:hypothetical protein